MNTKASSQSKSHRKHSALMRFVRSCMQNREAWAQQYVEKVHRDMGI